MRCIPASDVSASEAAFQGVNVTSLVEQPVVCVPRSQITCSIIHVVNLVRAAGSLVKVQKAIPAGYTNCPAAKPMLSSDCTQSACIFSSKTITDCAENHNMHCDTCKNAGCTASAGCKCKTTLSSPALACCSFLQFDDRLMSCLKRWTKLSC